MNFLISAFLILAVCRRRGVFFCVLFPRCVCVGLLTAACLGDEEPEEGIFLCVCAVTGSVLCGAGLDCVSVLCPCPGYKH